MTTTDLEQLTLLLREALIVRSPADMERIDLGFTAQRLLDRGVMVSRSPETSRGLYGFLDGQSAVLARHIFEIIGPDSAGALRLADQLIERGWRLKVEFPKRPIPTTTDFGR